MNAYVYACTLKVVNSAARKVIALMVPRPKLLFFEPRAPTTTALLAALYGNLISSSLANTPCYNNNDN